MAKIQLKNYPPIYKTLLLVVLLALVFTPVYYSSAFGGSGVPLPSVSSSVVEWVVTGTINFIRSTLGSFVALIAGWVDGAIAIDPAAAPIVTKSWEISRNFANMFFIVALIIMAFGTIFSLQGYDFRKLILSFLIAAILINFSLVIGEIIIGWSQSLSSVFLTAIGSVGDRLGQGLKIGDQLQNNLKTGIPVDTVVWQVTIAAVANVILLFMLLASMSVLLFFALVRVPILWALLIVSPLAWILYILPKTRQYNKMWWDAFISWNLFMPIYLFFIYFGVLFLNEPPEVLSGPSAIPGLQANLQSIFYYVLTGIFLVGGAKVALGFSRAGGAATVAGWGFARTAAMRRAAWRGTGLPGAYRKTADYYGREGIKLIPGSDRRFFGSRQAEQRGGGIAGVLGVPGLREQQLATNVSAASKKLRDKGIHLNRTELENKIANGSPEERIAAAQIFAEENYGALDPNQVIGVIGAFGGNLNTTLAASVLRKQKWNEMAPDDLRSFLNPTLPSGAPNPNYISDQNVRSSIFNALIEKRRATLPEFESALALSRSNAQRAGMIAKAKDLLGEDLGVGDRQGLLSRLTDDESRRELVKIMAQKGDSFFHDPNPLNPNQLDPNQARLHAFAELIENPGERKKFLDDVSTKNAYSAAMEMLDRNMIRDATGNTVTRTTHADAENQAIAQTLRKLSVKEINTQSRTQYNEAALQDAIGDDMARNIERYTKDDTYAAAQANLIPAQRRGKMLTFQRKYLAPFNDQSRQLKTRLAQLRASPPSPTALNTTKQELQNRMLRKLTNLRDDYEKFCRENNLMTDPADRARIQTELNRLDLIINKHTNDIASL